MTAFLTGRTNFDATGDRCPPKPEVKGIAAQGSIPWPLLFLLFINNLLLVPRSPRFFLAYGVKMVGSTGRETSAMICR